MKLRTCIIGITLGIGLGWAPHPSALAQAEDSSSVKGVPVVVELKGRRKHGADRLSRTLRRTLADALGGLRSSRALHREQARLGITDNESTRPSKLAEAGRGVAAEYLVFVRVTRKRRARYEAKGYLIDTKDAQVVHRSIVKFRRPSKEAGKAGVEIANSMLKGLTEIVAARQPPPPPPVVAVAPDPTPEPTPEPAPPVAPPPPAAAPSPEPTPPVAVAPAPEPTPEVQPPPSVQTPAPRRTTKDKALSLRIGLGGGAGVVRNYQVSADQLSASDLSHSLGPQGMARLGLELMLPTIGLGLAVETSLRPVGYTIVVDGENQDLSGLLIDARAALGYHLKVSERAGQAISLVPALGLRLSRAGVEDHPTNVVPSANLTVLFAEVGVRLPYDDNLTFELSADFGVVAGYSESPVTTGESAGGFAFGADLGVHYWISDLLGVAFDSRFSLDRLSLSERPTRAVPANEQANLQDANISITDLRTAVSVMFRF